MDAIARTCLKVIVDEKTADQMKPEFKKEVGYFIKTIVVLHA